MSIKMGWKVRDRISEATGVVTGIAEYVTGWRQVQISYSKDGESKTIWFDEQRLERVGDSVLTLNNEETPGFGPQAPTK